MCLQLKQLVKILLENNINLPVYARKLNNIETLSNPSMHDQTYMFKIHSKQPHFQHLTFFAVF